MVNFKKYFWTLACLPLLAACSTDDIVNGDGGKDDESITDGVYMTVSINPNGQNGRTRSQTSGDNSSSDGTEVGSDDENKVNSVLIVLANPDGNGYVASSLVKIGGANSPIKDLIVSGEKVYQAHAKFSKTDMSAFYSVLGNSEKAVNVFIYCNPMDQLVKDFDNLNLNDKDWVNKAYTFGATEDDNLWSKEKGFVMTNVRMAKRFLPASMDDWSFYSHESSPFDLSGINNPGLLTEVDNSSDNGNGGGTIDVHRMAARFDFRDGSQMNVPNGNGVEGVPFTYNTILGENAEGEIVPLVQTEIVNMSLVNMLNSQYYLGRVSADGSETGSTLLGAEKPWTFEQNGTVATRGNFVVSRYSSQKATGEGINSNYTNYFLYPFFAPNNQVQIGLPNTGPAVWDITYVKELCENGPKDNYNNESNYRVWRYVTENTIPAPGDNYNLQNNGQTTGIVFKAKMKGTPDLNKSNDPWDKKLYTALTTKTGSNSFTADILYSFAGKKLYCTWPHVQNAALQAAGFDPSKTTQSLDRSASLYMACFGSGGFGTVEYKYMEGDEVKTVTVTDDLDPDTNSANTAWLTWKDAGYPDSGNLLKNFREKVTGATFTIYQASQDPKEDWGYYCYYYYWNHHNDNLQNTVLGPMEIAVVRNNVYKLAVTRLNTLGHPRSPENDPDTPTPNTPDERGDIYLQVNLKVVPWVVRVNNIEF